MRIAHYRYSGYFFVPSFHYQTRCTTKNALAMTLHVVKGIADLQSLKHSTLPFLQGIHNVLTVSAFNCALRSAFAKSKYK